MAVFYSLCSSSGGNATYIGSEKNGILIDAGVGIRNYAAIMNLAGLSPSSVKAIFVTHEHTDHVKGLKRLTEKYDLPVYASKGTLEYLIARDLVDSNVQLYEINKHKAQVAGMEIEAFKTEHDAVDSQCYKVTTEDYKKLSICTDTGWITPEIEHSFIGCDFVMLESNYDLDMLENGGYPHFLKKRIRGKHGHLSNDACSDGIVKLIQGGTTQFMLGHLSEHNNTPETALLHTITKLNEFQMKINEDFKVEVAPVRNHGKVIHI